MITLKCKNCGGEMSVDSTGSLYCEYCGSKYAFRDDELLQYKNFRRQVLEYLRGVHDLKADGKSHEDLLWNQVDVETLRTKDGMQITVRYLYSWEDTACKGYLTRNSVLYAYAPDKTAYAEKTLRGIAKLDFPAADVKGLNDCFPKLVGRYDLEDGGVLLAFERADNLFPLAMFGSVEPRSVAWIVSRMENICCVLEYSGLVHGGISEQTIFINPFIHHAVLMGEWWKATEKEGVSRGQETVDLTGLRRTAEKVMGMQKENAPQAFLDFLKKKPEGNAYQDFEVWDQVIEEGFGGRKFTQWDENFE